MSNYINYGLECTTKACPFLSAGTGHATACMGERCSLWVASDAGESEGRDWSTCVFNKHLDQLAGMFFQLRG